MKYDLNTVITSAKMFYNTGIEKSSLPQNELDLFNDLTYLCQFYFNDEYLDDPEFYTPAVNKLILEFNTSSIGTFNNLAFTLINRDIDLNLKLYSRPNESSSWTKTNDIILFPYTATTGDGYYDSNPIKLIFDETSNKYYKIEIFVTTFNNQIEIGGCALGFDNSDDDSYEIKPNYIPDSNELVFSNYDDGKLLNRFPLANKCSYRLYNSDHNSGGVNRSAYCIITLNEPKNLKSLSAYYLIYNTGNILMNGVDTSHKLELLINGEWVQNNFVENNSEDEYVNIYGNVDLILQSGEESLFATAIRYTISWSYSSAMGGNGYNDYLVVDFIAINYDTLDNYLEQINITNITETHSPLITVDGNWSGINTPIYDYNANNPARFYYSGADVGTVTVFGDIANQILNSIDLFFDVDGYGFVGVGESFPLTISMYYKKNSQYYLIDSKLLTTGYYIRDKFRLKFICNSLDIVDGIKIVFNVENNNDFSGSNYVQNIGIIAYTNPLYVDYNSNIFVHDYELLADDSSPLKLYNGIKDVGIKIVDTLSELASPIRIYTGSEIKALAKVI
jgi:hypothetical protein